MADFTMGLAESKFADIVWNDEPITSSELWKKCEEALGWKKSTTFTVLKRLCDKGIFQNEKGIVTSLISKEELNSMKSEKFVEETFEGSLPAFLTSFTSRKTLTAEEVAYLRRMVEEYEEK